MKIDFEKDGWNDVNLENWEFPMPIGNFMKDAPEKTGKYFIYAANKLVAFIIEAYFDGLNFEGVGEYKGFIFQPGHYEVFKWREFDLKYCNRGKDENR